MAMILMMMTMFINDYDGDKDYWYFIMIIFSLHSGAGNNQRASTAVAEHILHTIVGSRQQ